jgi:hypothetical protein
MTASSRLIKYFIISVSEYSFVWIFKVSVTLWRGCKTTKALLRVIEFRWVISTGLLPLKKNDQHISLIVIWSNGLPVRLAVTASLY